MKHIIYILLLLLITSCQFFETDKITTETFYEEEMKTIDWKRVDQYPAFSNCENYTEKEAQKDCFINTLSKHVYGALQQQNIFVTKDIHDTIYLDFYVHKNARLEVTKVAIDSTLIHMFPIMENWLIDGVSAIKLVAPAYKRGIPVETKFTLPVVIQTGN
jgi:hypothetical protein